MSHRFFQSMANGFAFWQGQDISNATATYFDDIFQAFSHFQNLADSIGGIELCTDTYVVGNKLICPVNKIKGRWDG